MYITSLWKIRWKDTVNYSLVISNNFTGDNYTGESIKPQESVAGKGKAEGNEIQL
jgi:hypothetical protein